MANSAQAKKRARQSISRRSQNMSEKSSVRTSIKKFNAAVLANDHSEAASAYREMTSKIDRAARKGLSHKNQAARIKSRLNFKIKKII